MPIIQIFELVLKTIDAEISLVLQKEKQFSFDSFIGGYHTYIEIWTPKIGDGSFCLKCEDDCACNNWRTHWWACPKELE